MGRTSASWPSGAPWSRVRRAPDQSPCRAGPQRATATAAGWARQTVMAMEPRRALATRQTVRGPRQTATVRRQTAMVPGPGPQTVTAMAARQTATAMEPQRALATRQTVMGPRQTGTAGTAAAGPQRPPWVALCQSLVPAPRRADQSPGAPGRSPGAAGRSPGPPGAVTWGPAGPGRATTTTTARFGAAARSRVRQRARRRANRQRRRRSLHRRRGVWRGTGFRIWGSACARPRRARLRCARGTSMRSPGR